MLDLLMLAMGVGFFVLSIGYAHVCDRLWGGDHGIRLCAGELRDGRAAGLSHLRAASARAVL